MNAIRSDSRRHSLRGRLTAVAIAFLATLVAGPGQAVDIPNDPLQSQAAYPPANVRFILDDSGSMNLISMPASLADPDYDRGTGASGYLDDTNIRHASYGHNTIYYNPATTYLPWIKADGTRFTGGTSYTAAYRHTTLLSDVTDLSAGSRTSTFYVPKSEAVKTSTDPADFQRFQIIKIDGKGKPRVVRSEWGRLNRNNRGESDAGCDDGRNGDDGWLQCTFATPLLPTNPASSRSEADEMTNFAIWYSYHRSRMKVAKAGASEALSRVGEYLRIGLDTINRNTTGFPYDIPVGSDGGLFRGANKSTWFDRLQSAQGDGSTPLHRALQRAGDYFSRSDAAGPWDSGTTASQISCRQNFAILTTDGYWNSTDGFASVGDADGTAGPANVWTDALGNIKKSYTYAPAKPYQDNFVETSTKSRPNTLADVAMYYWKRDLRSDLENNVPESLADEAFWQHMVTFGVSIGLKGNLDPSSDLPSIRNGTKHWPDPINGGENRDRIDDLWHASVNGRGDFLVASNSKEFTDGLLAAFAEVAKRLGSASNVTANSTSFVTNGRVYQASYLSGAWSGELAAYDASTADVKDDTPVWRASTLIPTSGRNLLTWGGRGGASFPTSAQIALLDQSSRAIAPVNGTDNAAYIAGDRSKEKQNGAELRDRGTVLGDIANSSPVYVKESQTIFVGANDGMLHAFDATTGAELFAYVPGGINFTNLASLSNPRYLHQYFVDGPLMVSSRAVTPGKNYLVGALGRGGKGMYALDVTTPKTFRATDVLWELNSGANLGQVLGEPLISHLGNGTAVAIFGNGINSAGGKAVLYVVDLLTGAVLNEIDTGAGGDNGLFSPRGWDENGDGSVDYVFAGDLKGHVWKFDFTGATPSIGYGGRPMFTTASGQPVTADLALAQHPKTGQRWVFAGTGSLLSKLDLTDDTVQSMYALIDEGSSPIAVSELQARTIAVVDATTGNRAFEASGTLPAGKRGWYLNLSKPSPGERVLSRPLVDGSALFFASVVPPTSNVCDAGGNGYLNAIDAFTGTSLADSFFDTNGDRKFDEKDTLEDGSGNKVATGSINPGVGMPTKPIIIRGADESVAVVGGSTGGLADPAINPPGSAPRRVSWREILHD